MIPQIRVGGINMIDDIKDLAEKLDSAVRELLNNEPTDSQLEELKALNEQLNWIDIIY